MHLLAGYRVLAGNGPLLRLLAGEFVSAVGDWLYFVALLVLVYAASGSAIVVGLVGATRQVPYILLSVPAGIVADRYDRRLLLVATNLCRGAVMLVLTAVAVADGPLWLVFGLAVIATCVATPFGPTIGALIPEFIRDESEFAPANSAFATIDNLSYAVGPAAGGLLILAGGLPVAFLLNAIAFALGAVMAWRLPTESQGIDPAVGSQRPARHPRHVRPLPMHDAAPGEVGTEPAVTPSFRSVVAPLGGLFAFASVTHFFTGGLEVMTVLIAVKVLGVGDGDAGFLNAAIGVGGIAGALVSGWLVITRRLDIPLVLGALAMGAGLVAVGSASGLAFAIVALAVMEAGNMVLDVGQATLLHRSIPDDFRGRALGTMNAVRKTALVAGAILLPIAADDLYTRHVLVASGIITVVACSGLVILLAIGRVGAPPVVVSAAARVPTLPIFAGLKAPRLEAAMERMRELDVPAGQVVVREGEPADRFYVIAEGKLRVSRARGRSGDETLRELGPGNVFGEIGLLRGIPRTATVTAETDCLLASLDGQDFLDLVSSGPGVRSRFLNLYARDEERGRHRSRERRAASRRPMTST